MGKLARHEIERKPGVLRLRTVKLEDTTIEDIISFLQRHPNETMMTFGGLGLVYVSGLFPEPLDRVMPLVGLGVTAYGAYQLYQKYEQERQGEQEGEIMPPEQYIPSPLQKIYERRFGNIYAEDVTLVRYDDRACLAFVIKHNEALHPLMDIKVRMVLWTTHGTYPMERTFSMRFTESREERWCFDKDEIKPEGSKFVFEIWAKEPFPFYEYRKYYILEGKIFRW